MNNSTNEIFFRLVFAGFVLAFLANCSNSYLSGASSMRISVDVYKGALANAEGIQKGQLDAILRAAGNAVNDVEGQLVASMCRIGCIAKNRSEMDYQQATKNDYKFWEPQKSDCDELLVESRNKNLKPGVANQPPNRDKICPVYVRLRQQLGDMKENLKPEKHDKRFNFLISMDQYQAIIDIEKTLLEQMIEPKRARCEVLKNSDEKARCRINIDELAASFTAMKTEIDNYKNSLNGFLSDDSAIGEVMANLSNAVTVQTYLSFVGKLISKSQTMQAAAGRAVVELDKAQKPLAFRHELSEFAILINGAADDFEKYRKSPISSQAFEQRLDDLSGVSDAGPLATDNYSTWEQSLAHLVAEAAFLANNQKVRSARIEEFNKKIAERNKGALKVYLAQNPLSMAELKTTTDAAKQVDTRLGKINGALHGKSSGLVRSMNEVKRDLDAQKKLTAEYEKIKPSLVLPADLSEQPGENSRIVLALRASLDVLANLVKVGKKTGWEADNARLASIEGEVKTSLQALQQVVAAKKWVGDDGNRTAETQNLVKSLDKYKSLSLPDTKVRATGANKAKNAVQGLVKLVNPEAGEPPLRTILGENGLAGTYEPLETELRKDRASVAKDGLRPDEVSLFATLKQTEAVLTKQNALLSETTDKLKKALNLARQKQANNDKQAYAEVASLAAGFRVLATGISYQLASVSPPDKRLLIDMVKTANMAAEFANQLTARANALSQQADGIDRSIISTGQYLRDTQPTAFLDSYHWLNAATGGEVSPEWRVKISKQLFADDNWARINEVYASGTGETSMAFIKDSIGNWNLKSFENDPSRLTDAYANLGVSLLERAAVIASGAATEAVAGEVSSLVQSAQAVQSGNSPDTSEQRTGAILAGLDLEGFRSELAQELEKIKTDHDEKETEIEAIDCEQLPKELQDTVYTTTGPGEADKEFGCPKQTARQEMDKQSETPEPDTTQAGQNSTSGEGGDDNVNVDITVVTVNDETTGGDEAETATSDSTFTPETNEPTVVDAYKKERLREEAISSRNKAIAVVQRFKDLITALMRVGTLQPKPES